LRTSVLPKISSAASHVEGVADRLVGEWRSRRLGELRHGLLGDVVSGGALPLVVAFGVVGLTRPSPDHGVELRAALETILPCAEGFG
jgi:hypothetical protein